MIYEKIPVVLLSVLNSEKTSSTNRIIAEYILSHRDEISGLGIKDLAERCYVGTGSISRFVRDIGLKDFTELKTLLRTTEYHYEKAEEDLDKIISRAVQQCISSIDIKQIEALCRSIHDHQKISAYGLLKAEAAAIDLETDLFMMGKRICTCIAYRDQIREILEAGKDDLIIIFSYTGSFFAYHDLRSTWKHLCLPEIWMISGSEEESPVFVNHTIRFHSAQNQHSHPYQLEAIAGLIAQKYAEMFL